jgi:ATP-binding cassette subfamily C protein CydCD
MSATSPFREGGLGPGGKKTLYRLGLISAARALALVMIATALADGVVSVINQTQNWHADLVWGVLAGVVRALLGWAGTVASTRAALGAKQTLRSQLAERLLAEGNSPVGSSSVLATRGLNELDDYYCKVLPAAMNAAVIPLLIGVRILFADWLSAVVIVLTVPLIPVFMTLVGLHTRDQVAKATLALSRLSDHLVELARGLPVLLGLGRVTEQSAALKKVSDEYQSTTMRTLKTAFLSSLVLELISTISVAVVAVFIGLRLVNGSLALETGLLVLILAPECYAPFRELGGAFHAAQNGLAALGSVRAIVDRALPVSAHRVGDTLAISHLTIRYPDRQTLAVDDLNVTIADGEFVQLAGRSGSGKSSVLAALAGRLATGTDGAQIDGTITGIAASRIAWVPQHPMTVGESVLDELTVYADGIPEPLRREEIDELAHRFGIFGLLGDDPAQLSPGELRRVAVVRAMLRVAAGAKLLLLDEPTAHLDPANTRVVVREIERLRGEITIVIASHDPVFSALMPRRIQLGRGPEHAEQYPAISTLANEGDRTEVLRASSPADQHRADDSFVGTVRLLRDFLRPATGRFVTATTLGAFSTLFAIALTTVSGWLIVRASQEPAIMYILVAIVGVRFFGIGRSVLQYGERVLTHTAVFTSVGALRMRLWAAFADRGAWSRKLLKGGSTIDYLVLSADRVRDLAPRVVLPAVVGVTISVASLIAVGLLLTPALILYIAVLLICLVIAPVAATWSNKRAGRRQILLESEMGRQFAGVLAASGDVKANGVDGVIRERLRFLDARLSGRARRSAWTLGLGQAVVILTLVSAAFFTLLIAQAALSHGLLAPQIVAVVVLLPLALIEPMLAYIDAIQLWPNLADALRASALDPEPASIAGAHRPRLSAIPTANEMELLDLAATWPDAATPVFSGLTLKARVGQWVIVRGRSGSGKSTLVAMLMGYLRPSVGQYRLDDTDTADLEPSALRRHVAWSPQDAHLFNSTIRANLLLARPKDEAPTESEMLEVLERAGLGAFFASLALGLDTRVGSEGNNLSGGERQRLAVARTLLTKAEVVLFDEPTAHLDFDTARDLISQLRVATAGQIAVLVTHRPDDSAETDTIIDLEQLGSATRAEPILAS